MANFFLLKNLSKVRTYQRLKKPQPQILAPKEIDINDDETNKIPGMIKQETIDDANSQYSKLNCP